MEHNVAESGKRSGVPYLSTRASMGVHMSKLTWDERDEANSRDEPSSRTMGTENSLLSVQLTTIRIDNRTLSTGLLKVMILDTI